MALVKKQTNSTRLVIVAAVIVAVGVVGYFLFKQFFLATPTTNIAPITSGQHGIVTDFGEGILNDSRYTGLQVFGSNVNASAATNPGQPNPFQ